MLMWMLILELGVLGVVCFYGVFCAERSVGAVWAPTTKFDTLLVFSVVLNSLRHRQNRRLDPMLIYRT